jgi:hypothetical protein
LRGKPFQDMKFCICFQLIVQTVEWHYCRFCRHDLRELGSKQFFYQSVKLDCMWQYWPVCNEWAFYSQKFQKERCGCQGNGSHCRWIHQR